MNKGTGEGLVRLDGGMVMERGMAIGEASKLTGGHPASVQSLSCGGPAVGIVS